MIVNKYNYGGGGSGSGVTPQEVQAQIDSALTPYWNSAATESAITQSVSGKADAANIEANPSALMFAKWNNQGIVQGMIGSEVYNRELKINGDAKSYFTNTQYHSDLNFYAPVSAGTAGQVLVSTGNGAPVWSAVTGGDMSGYYTSAQTDEKIASAVTPVANHLAEVEQITASAYTELHDGLMEVSARTMPDMSLYTPTTGFSTINGSAITNGGNLVIQGGGGDMSNYWNSAQTKSYVDSAATNLQDQIDTMDEVVSDALIDLNARVLHTVKSTDDSIVNIVKIEQTAYNTLVSQSATSSTTLYIVVPDAQ